MAYVRWCFLRTPCVMNSEPVDTRLPKTFGTAYTLERELGRGGMATVYVARDAKHDRRVAVKVLHAELGVAVAVDRFLHEIRVVATLQHPHILGLIDSGVLGDEWGESKGLPYYVMPFVDGESLRARLERERQLPVAEALRLAREVADALDHAHHHGVVHRDIKPENVLLQGGHALVADFGIALALQHAGGARLTGTGLSLGTPHYMAPEQAAGDRAVNASADIYALGAVTYEMLVGEPPFTGPSPQAVLARAVTEEPRLVSASRRTVPPHVDRVVRTALEKLPADRFSSAAEFATALAGPAGQAATSLLPVSPSNRRGVPWRAAILTVAGLGVGFALGRAGQRAQPINKEPVRFVIEPDSGIIQNTGLAVSPDGRTIVYRLEATSGATLHRRRARDLESHEIPGTANGQGPMFSPDGRSIAFLASGAIRKTRLDGGSSTVISGAEPVRSFSIGSWAWDDGIYFCTTVGDLYRVSASGGEVKRLLAADSTSRVTSVQLLPARRIALVTVMRDSVGYISALDLESGRLRELGPGLHPHYAMDHVVFTDPEGRLYAQSFDADQAAPNGNPQQLADMVSYGPGIPLFDVSQSGAIVYRIDPASARTLWLLDRAGREVLTLAGYGSWGPRFSPDGRRVAYGAIARGRAKSDIWIADLESGTTQRFTTDGNSNNDAQWSPDGRAIIYSAEADAGKDVFQQSLNGGAARPVLRQPGAQYPSDWSRSGKVLLFTQYQTDNTMGVWLQPLDSGTARPYIDTRFNEAGGRLSPNGSWVAYTSNETGLEEVYVQAFPTPGQRTLVSVGGGFDPVWRGDGQELYYFRGDQLIAASLALAAAGEPPVVRSRTPLFRVPYLHSANANYDASPDGKRFVVLGRDRGRSNRVAVWLHALDGIVETSSRGRTRQ
jgi:eukaryotic-like serine/threonine-protein kinase